MAEDKDVKYDFSEETIKRKRKFPVARTVLLVILILLQIGLAALMVFYEPKPQDEIAKYRVYVTPKSDGTLDIEYRILWTPLDEDEPLTFIYVGVPNHNCTVTGYSDNVSYVEEYYQGGQCHVDLILDREYYAGETLEIALNINQGSMLCRRGDQYFYELVPCWFNATPVSSYTFFWRKTEGDISTNSDSESEDWYIWNGSMEPGDYRLMRVDREPSDAKTTYYGPFDDSDVYNELHSDRIGIIILLAVGILVLFIFEVFLVDTVISYYRGRGFISGYGHPMYTYGRANRFYIIAHNQHSVDNAAIHSNGVGGHGGCACACACACAGGGRAGCSQKDTYKAKKTEDSDSE